MFLWQKPVSFPSLIFTFKTVFKVNELIGSIRDLQQDKNALLQFWDRPTDQYLISSLSQFPFLQLKGEHQLRLIPEKYQFEHLKTSQNIQPCTVFGEHSIHCSIYLVSSSPYYSSRQWSCGRLKVSQKRFFFHLVPTIHYTKRSVIPLSSTEDNPPFNGRQGGCWEGESASESSRKFLLAPRQLRSHRGSRAETWTMLRFVSGSLQCIWIIIVYLFRAHIMMVESILCSCLGGVDSTLRRLECLLIHLHGINPILPWRCCIIENQNDGFPGLFLLLVVLVSWFTVLHLMYSNVDNVPTWRPRDRGELEHWQVGW